jgi:predicted esterase
MPLFKKSIVNPSFINFKNFYGMAVKTSDQIKEISVVSSIDGSEEKNLFFHPGGAEKVPLVIGLHTWSFDRNNKVGLLDFCQQRRWGLLLPEFRGPNLLSNPRATQACGSKLAMQDVIDAINFVSASYPIDSSNIFLFGGSGGGHMALMLAAYAPEIWRGVSAWCPITDLREWHRYYGKSSNYSVHLEACCGGAPGDNAAVDNEYAVRSPISYLEQLMKAKLYIHHGRGDHSVPYSHTLTLALKLEEMGHQELFFEIFDGGHEIRNNRAFDWFDSLMKHTNKDALTG